MHSLIWKRFADVALNENILFESTLESKYQYALSTEFVRDVSEL